MPIPNKMLTLILLLFVCACTEEVVLEPDPEPQITDGHLSYSPNDREFFISAKVQDVQGEETIDSVTVKLFLPLNAGSQLLAGALMNDEGFDGDILSSDGVYTTKIANSAPDTIMGYFLFVVEARDEDGNFGQLVDSTLLGNKAPVISNLDMPDSIQIHPTDMLYFSMSVIVFDTNGADDIAAVIYEVSSDSIKYDSSDDWVLSDDGIDPDSNRGDGIYTGRASVKPLSVGGKTGRFYFRFSARDRQSQRSNYLHKTLTIYE